MWRPLVFLVLPWLSSAINWQSGLENPHYPDFGGPLNSNQDKLRRRPPLDQIHEDIEFVVSPRWPDPSVNFGQIAAVTVDKDGHVVIFHRGPHVWDALAFDQNDNYMPKDKGPIDEDTVIVLDPDSGKVLKSWGRKRFYMPHGLTIDHEDNVWVTDVALHQVFKFSSLASLDKNSNPLLTLGKRFVNGKDENHFCKPSAVAVLKNGDFFVSDGYCNSRIFKYDKEGTKLMVWGRSSFVGDFGHKPGPYQFSIPHALTIAEDRNLLCVADRENGRVQCFNSLNGTFAFEISSDLIGPRLFSVAYTPTHGGLFFIVNGPSTLATPVQGFVVDARSLKIVSKFQAGSEQLSNPHDVAVSSDGESVYVVQLDPHRALKFVHKGSESLDDQPSSPNGANQGVAQISELPSNPPPSSKPTATSIEATNSSSTLPVGLNLMANSSFARAMSTPLVAVTSLMVILLCVTGSGVVWFMRSRRRGRPPVLEFDMSEPGYERSSLMHDDDDD